MSNFKKYTANPFYMSNSLMILLFFTGWGIWWSFFQIWLTTKQGFFRNTSWNNLFFQFSYNIDFNACVWFTTG